LGQLVGGRIGGVTNGAAGSVLGSRAASWLNGLLPPHEYEAEFEDELEISPIRRIYPEAILEHLGHAAAETESEAEAEALAGAMIPLAVAGIPRSAAPTLMRATPGLVSGLSGVVHGLRRNPATRPLVRVVPTIVRSTATNIAREASRGVPVSPQAAVRTLARQTLRMLGSPHQSARAFRRSRALDGHFHRSYRTSCGGHCGCANRGARGQMFDFEAPQLCREGPGLTAAQCRIVSQARNEAIKLANKAASKLDAAVVFGPRTKEAEETARLFKFFFCHDPRLPVPWAGNKASGASVAFRFRAVARELGGGRRIIFRSDPHCRGHARAHTHQEIEPNVINLCAPFWTPPPGLRGLPPEVFRGGTILHEMLHVLFTDFFHHQYPPHSRTTERKRNNAHCYKAFALRVAEYGADLDVVPQCTSRPC
jgi:hypothetical protein